MNALSQRLVRAAISRGYTEANPILLTTDQDGVRVNVVVSASEPHSIRSPLNLIWINPVANSVQKRTGRESTPYTNHTWVDDFEFFEPQVWDEPIPSDQPYRELNANVGNTHNLELADLGGIGEMGGTFIGPVVIREDSDYADNEAVPLGFIKNLLARFENLVTSVRLQGNTLRAAITGHTRRIVSLELMLGSIEAVRSYSEEFESAEQWPITHNMDSEYIYMWVTKPDGTNVIYDKLEVLDRNNCVAHFAKPVEGRAVVVSGVHA